MVMFQRAAGGESSGMLWIMLWQIGQQAALYPELLDNVAR